MSRMFLSRTLNWQFSFTRTISTHFQSLLHCPLLSEAYMDSYFPSLLCSSFHFSLSAYHMLCDWNIIFYCLLSIFPLLNINSTKVTFLPGSIHWCTAPSPSFQQCLAGQAFKYFLDQWGNKEISALRVNSNYSLVIGIC